MKKQEKRGKSADFAFGGAVENMERQQQIQPQIGIIQIQIGNFQDFAQPIG